MIFLIIRHDQNGISQQGEIAAPTKLDAIAQAYTIVICLDDQWLELKAKS